MGAVTCMFLSKRNTEFHQSGIFYETAFKVKKVKNKEVFFVDGK